MLVIWTPFINTNSKAWFYFKSLIVENSFWHKAFCQTLVLSAVWSELTLTGLIVFCKPTLHKYSEKWGQSLQGMKIHLQKVIPTRYRSLAHWRSTEQLGNTDSWEPPRSPTDPRCSPVPPFPAISFTCRVSRSPSLSPFPMWGKFKKKQNWQSRVPVVKRCFFFSANYSSPLLPLIPDVANLVWRCQSYANVISKKGSRTISLL